MNILLWLAMLAAALAPIVFALKLKASGRVTTANLILLIPAIPGFLFGVFLFMLILLQPDWR